MRPPWSPRSYINGIEATSLKLRPPSLDRNVLFFPDLLKSIVCPRFPTATTIPTAASAEYGEANWAYL